MSVMFEGNTDNKPAQVAVNVWRYFLDIILSGVESMLTISITTIFYQNVLSLYLFAFEYF